MMQPTYATPEVHTLARWTDPLTSKAAARRVGELSRSHVAAILRALKEGPASKTGLAQRTGIEAHSIGRRLGEMEKQGLIRLTGNTVPSAAGRPEREWEVAQ